MAGFNPVAAYDRKVIPPYIVEDDKSTVFSIFPRPLDERKETLNPGIFKLDAGSYEKPSRLVVGQSYWIKDPGPDEDLISIVTPSALIASSICNDLGLIMSGADARPGVFWVKGELTVEELKKKYPDALPLAKKRQDEWFKLLITMADVDWSRANGNPLAIWDVARQAAEALGIKDKDWLQNQNAFERIPCVACGTFNKPGLALCPNCKVVIDEAKFKSLGLKFANQ